MSIRIRPGSKVYVVAPAGVATGGPELLHQLCFHLRNSLYINSYMYYVPENHSHPVHPAYKDYQNPFIKSIEDTEENVLIVPEIFDDITKYRFIRKVIWWLSVDNLFLLKIFNSKRNLFFHRAVNELSSLILKKELVDTEAAVYKKYLSFDNMITLAKRMGFIRAACCHMVQSFYARDFLEKTGIKKPIYYLSDYLNKNFLGIKTDFTLKKNIVVYNPKKGFHFTGKIIKFASDIEFIPVINMTRQQVIETLQSAKVYIDFGNHPGKDRLPREAAILGCCVITGKRGSAKYYEDVSIPEKYKFEDTEKNIPEIVGRIKDCLYNFEKRCRDFDYYRKVILQEPEKFLEDLKRIFIKV